MNIFQQAVAKQKAKPKAKDEKFVVPVELGDKLTRLQQVRNEMKDLEAEETTLVGDIKPIASEQFIELYKQSKVRPDSFVLQSDDGGRLLVIVQDKYLKVTDVKEAAIRDEYKKQADEIIEKETTYSFNNKHLAKYQKQIAAALEGIKGVPDNVKAELIEATEVKKIKKGTISKLYSYKQPEMLYQLIQPVIQLKNQNEDED